MSRYTISKLRLLAAVLLLLALTACGGGDDASVDASGGDMAMDDDHSSFEFGEPAEADDADRTLEITALDEMAYDPPSVDVEAGETIRFVVTNAGAAVHEFTLGDSHLQEEHEEEMQEMMSEGQMTMEDEANALSIEPGDTEELTWHFTEAGTLEYACHQPGHYASGMTGTVTVS